MKDIKKIIYVILLVKTCFVLSMEKEQDKKEQVKEEYTVNTSKEDANKLWHGLNDSSSADFSSSASNASSSSSQSSSALSVSPRSEEWNKEGYQNYLEEKEIKNILDQAIKTGKIGKINADQESKVRKLILKVYGAGLNQIVPRGIDSVNLGAKLKKYELYGRFLDCSQDGKVILMDEEDGGFLSLLNVEDLTNIHIIAKKAIESENEKGIFSIFFSKLVRNGKWLLLLFKYENVCKSALYDIKNLDNPLCELNFDSQGGGSESHISPNGSLIVIYSIIKDQHIVEFYEVYNLADEYRNNILSKNVMEIISEYEGRRVKILNKIILNEEFKSIGFIKEAILCLTNKSLMLFDKPNNFVPKVINLEFKHKKERGLSMDISNDSRNILMNTLYGDHDYRAFYLIKTKDIYDKSCSLKLDGSDFSYIRRFSGDGKYISNQEKHNKYNIQKIMDGGLELFCEFEHFGFARYLANNCRFLIHKSNEKQFIIYDLENTCIWDDLSSEQLIYVIRLISGLEDGGDIDKIFANLGNKFIERLKEYFKFSFDKHLSALLSKVMKIINSYRFDN